MLGEKRRFKESCMGGELQLINRKMFKSLKEKQVKSYFPDKPCEV
jgi:hypothetical protein